MATRPTRKEMEKEKEFRRLKFKFEGTLDAILEVGPTFDHPLTGDTPMGGSVESVFGGYYTKLVISVENKREVFTYNCIILPDSIGHKIRVHERRGLIVIHDTKLDRWYETDSSIY